MKKTLIFLLLLNLGIGGLYAQKGCQAYCVSAKECCEGVSRIEEELENGKCQKQYDDCIKRYAETENDKCPPLVICD